MTTTVHDRTDALAERLFRATLGALELFSVYLGAELGLYLVLAASGPLTAAELAARADIAPRYAREWLEQQAVAGMLGVENVDAGAETRRYVLPPTTRGCSSTPMTRPTWRRSPTCWPASVA